MKNFNTLIKTDQIYKELEKEIISGNMPQLITGVSASHKAHFIYSLTQNVDRTALVITPDDASAKEMTDDINTMLGNGGAVYFPGRELTFYETEGIVNNYEHMRLGVLNKIIEGQAQIVVASIEAATILTIPPKSFIKNTMSLEAGKEYKLEELAEKLVMAGYKREAQIEAVAQFSMRGGIVDIFPVGEANPYRIEFWGDEIDTISAFEVFSQRRSEGVKKIKITPVRETIIENDNIFVKKLEKIRDKQAGKTGKLIKENLNEIIEKIKSGAHPKNIDKFLPIIYDDQATIFDYCEESLAFFCEPANVREAHRNFMQQHTEDLKILLEKGVISKETREFYISFDDVKAKTEKMGMIILDAFTRGLPDVQLKGIQNLGGVQVSNWSGSYQILKEDLDSLVRENYKIIVMTGSDIAAQTLERELITDGFSASRGVDYEKLKSAEIYVSENAISAGIKYPEIGLVVLTHSRVADQKKKRRRRYKAGKKVRNITDLNLGDHIVHSSHGIGIYKGIIKRTIQNVTKDYIKIQYAGTDALFIPVTQLDLVSKYIGAAEGKVVRLNRLNSIEWQKTRARVKGAVKEMAKELTILYAKRQNTKGHAFKEDTDWQNEFEQYFPYEETEDQLTSVEEIKRDMEKPIPMDRLLCGDVGFGKTEVALRAIFKCVMDGKQAAVLVPTTILAWQHYQTFVARFKDYPAKIELLSRFKTPKQQKEILKKLKSGEIDIIIGTHRVVQKDVVFKDLGLCVIDEEQRFGVAHKERFKELRTSVDILTLSATPIPRTLNMAMSGIRDMSLIEDPPLERTPVQTYVMEYDEGIIMQAIQKELRRDGQVFYLHNNTNTIDRCASNLQKGLPDATVEVAHGKMGEERLSDIWRRLLDKEIDVLVCTTIIETGIDIANANTLIIEDSDNYGLSQLYQLRGRVGRSPRRAYAYFTFRKNKALSEIASKRLEAIREFTDFGSGFQIAMRDLQIRGAGNILGAKQHGHMEAVGYDMYVKLLNEAVSEETGQTISSRPETIMDIQLDAHIPEQYIYDNNQRIDIYKRIASIENNDDAMDVIDELIDRFGEPPKEVVGLIDIALVRSSASENGIAEIKQSGQNILFYPENFDLELAGDLVMAVGSKVLINAGDRPYYSVKLGKQGTALEEIKGIIAEISDIANKKSLTD